MSGFRIRGLDRDEKVPLARVPPWFTLGGESGSPQTAVVRSRDPEFLPAQKGTVMPRVVVTHAVQDIDRWLAGKQERAAAIESASASNVTDYVASDGSNNVAITADVADLDEMGAMLSHPSPETLATMEAHGVVQPISAYIEK